VPVGKQITRGKAEAMDHGMDTTAAEKMREEDNEHAELPLPETQLLERRQCLIINDEYRRSYERSCFLHQC